jgi:RTX calcium-binding nonapeptide repeat (4 copies)
VRGLRREQNDDAHHRQRRRHTITGTNSADHLEGRGGNDFLIGKLGADTLDGGAGNDFVVYTNSGNVDLPPWSGGTGSERHAALSMVIPSMLARASAGVR